MEVPNRLGKLVDDILRRAARGDFVNDLLGDGGAAKQLPLHMTIGKEHLVEHARARQVCKQHAKGDGQQQQRLKLFDNRKVQQHAGNHQHNQAERILLDNIKARLLQKVDNSVHGVLSLLLKCGLWGRSKSVKQWCKAECRSPQRSPWWWPQR